VYQFDAAHTPCCGGRHSPARPLNPRKRDRKPKPELNALSLQFLLLYGPRGP